MKMLTDHYARCGHAIFRGAIPITAVSALETASQLIPFYSGEIRRQNGQMEANRFHPDTSLVANAVCNAHLSMPEGLEAIHSAICEIVTGDELWRCLHALDGAERYTVHQSILFFTSPSTDLHIDSWAMDTFPHGYAHSVWIPLQDMSRQSGMPCVVPWPVGKLISEADLGIAPASDFNQRYAQYHDSLTAKIEASSPDVVSAFLRRGDVFVWSSLTPHCTMPAVPFHRERLALQLMVRPTHYDWGRFTNKETGKDVPETNRISFWRARY